MILVWRLVFWLISWWWLPLPFLLWPLAKRAWLWQKQEVWESHQQYILLEIIPPKATVRPIASMEQVLTNVWSIYSSLEGWKNFRKKWGEGRRLYHFCFEIVSVGPQARFYLRLNKHHVDSVKAAFYAQYPDIEFQEATERYTHGVSALAPDNYWDLYGFDIMPTRSDAYPIKTYTQFFEPKADTSVEEKRIEPLNTLLEGLNQLKPEEQIWLQFRMMPVSDKDSDYRQRAKSLIGHLTHRQDKPAGKDKENFMPPEMKLTQREREIVKAMEDKLGKYVFLTNIRCLYLAPKEIYGSGRRALAEQYFSSFSAPDLNVLKKWSETKTKIRHFFIERREYLRKRGILRRYLMRETPLYPRRGGTFILSTEELATMIHLPVQLSGMGTMLPHSESKRSGGPVDLPI